MIKTITDWPVIVQGALGSSLFWLILIVGQKLTAYSTRKISARSAKRRLDYLYNQKDKYLGLQAHLQGNVSLAADIATGLIYKSFRSLFSGLIWMALGMVFSSLIPVLGVVGYVGCIYYMFKGLGGVQRVDAAADVDQKLGELDKQIEQLELNNAKHGDR